MNETFTQRQLPFLLRLAVLSLVFFGAHTLIVYYWYPETPLFYPLWIIYAFHFVTVLVIYTIINLRVARGKKKIFYTFMVFTFLKMALAIVFLLPLLFSEIKEKQADVFNFFIPYFLFLAVEVYAITRFLKKL